MNPKESNCCSWEFISADEFQRWRQAQHFRIFSLCKQEAEWACIIRYVDALIQTKNSLVDWPMQVQKSESPDFLLRFGTQTSIGVEHTTITSTKYQQFRAESLKRSDEEVVWLDRFKLGGKPQSLVNSGWVGNEVEQEWAILALKCVLRKLHTLNGQKFQRLPRMELLLNTVSYLPEVKLQVAVPLLASMLSKEISETKYPVVFDAITFIYCGSTLPHGVIKMIE